MLNKAVIDLNILTKNALSIKRKLNKKTLFNAVVKADAYGHGAETVANALYKVVDSYSVALAEEGIRLRLSGIDKDILCFTPFDYVDAPRAISLGLTATATNAEQIKMLAQIARNQGRTINVHIKYNTGMNRQGVNSIDELKQLIQLIEKEKSVVLSGLYSHFARPNNKKSLKCALNKFLLANNLVKGYNNKAICHISASGGFLQGVELDMVRIGILLYGYTPFPTNKLNVQPVMKVYAPVLCQRHLKKGECALYGDKKTFKDTNVALVRYGYADGLPRTEIDGQFNNRCMDLTAYTTTYDTAYTKAQSCEHDFLVMENAEQLAKKYQTISYEILTKCAIRAEKIYLR